MRPRFTWPDPRIDAVRGCVAVERGPEVLCLEGIDLPEGVDLDSLRIDRSAAPTERDGTVYVTGRLLDPTDPHWPYRVDAPTADHLSDPGSGFGLREVESPSTRTTNGRSAHPPACGYGFPSLRTTWWHRKPRVVICRPHE